MKKQRFYLFCILTIFMTLTSCENTPKNPYQQKILGRWICSQINNTELNTNNIFVIEFKENNIASYCRGVEINDTTKMWMEEDMFCGLSNDFMSIKSRPNNSSTKTLLNLRIKSVTDSKMVFQVEKHSIDTIIHSTGDLYTFVRENVNYQSLMLGMWKGNHKNKTSIWNYKNMGKYDFYIYDSQDCLFSNIDKSYYRLYGNLLVCIYENDVFKPILGKTYENWLIYPNGIDKFQMKALRKNIGEELIEIEKILALP